MIAQANVICFFVKKEISNKNFYAFKPFLSTFLRLLTYQKKQQNSQSFDY